MHLAVVAAGATTAGAGAAAGRHRPDGRPVPHQPGGRVRRDPFRLDDHAYGSIFYLMTGFHGRGGRLVFMEAVAVAIAGRSRAPAHQTVEVCGYYWHFVDVVWVVMFAAIYLLRCDHR